MISLSKQQLFLDFSTKWPLVFNVQYSMGPWRNNLQVEGEAGVLSSRGGERAHVDHHPFCSVEYCFDEIKVTRKPCTCAFCILLVIRLGLLKLLVQTTSSQSRRLWKTLAWT